MVLKSLFSLIAFYIYIYYRKILYIYYRKILISNMFLTSAFQCIIKTLNDEWEWFVEAL